MIINLFIFHVFTFFIHFWQGFLFSFCAYDQHFFVFLVFCTFMYFIYKKMLQIFKNYLVFIFNVIDDGQRFFSCVFILFIKMFFHFSFFWWCWWNVSFSYLNIFLLYFKYFFDLFSFMMNFSKIILHICFLNFRGWFLVFNSLLYKQMRPFLWWCTLQKMIFSLMTFLLFSLFSQRKKSVLFYHWCTYFCFAKIV